MKVLHLSKTSQGSRWASAQAGVLTRRGIEVHVALPDLEGPVTSEWIANGAQVHRIDYTLLPLRPFATNRSLEQLRRLVDLVQPDLIHAHHVKAAIMARLALRGYYPVPRVFQVPGPFHMERFPFRMLELATATAKDYWIATSRAILSHYLRAGVHSERVLLSYAGTENERFNEQRTGQLRRHLGLADSEFVVGNISYVYAPKWYLMQRVGLKRHEDLIDGISLAAEKDRSIRGVLIGGPWGTDPRYFEKLRQYARERSCGAVIMPGAFNQEEVTSAIWDFDCVAHVPNSENCGGVVEPLLCGIPTIASRTGGLVEVVKDGSTGITVPVGDPGALSEAILFVRNHYSAMRNQAHAGRMLVQTMFDVNRTAAEVEQIYRYVLGQRTSVPEEFNCEEFLKVRGGGDIGRGWEQWNTAAVSR
ncbi:MAG: glycosyltransferase family 4 protein [Candidatus Acidiferrum sp.]